MSIEDIKKEIVSHIPALRRYAFKFSPDEMDELVQITIMRAMANLHRFDGTNLGGWLTVILRNVYLNLYRTRKRKNKYESPMREEVLYLRESGDNQETYLIAKETVASLERLPPNMREVLMLVCEGLSYEEVAEACQIKLGTVKSRVSRARAILKNDEIPQHVQ